MSKDVFGLLLAVAALLIVWLWATGRIANTWQAMKGGAASPSTEQGTSQNQPGNAPTGTPLLKDIANLPGVPLPNTATGSPYSVASDILTQFGQEIVPANFPTWQTWYTPGVNNTPANMTLDPATLTYV
jgi:hypothetical protein